MKPVETPARFHMPEWLLRLLFTRKLKEKQCSHLHLIEFLEPSRRTCEECAMLGDTWPNLRICLICGYVGCCDTSKNKHMKQHVESTGHPLIRTIEHGEGWVWCYEDDAFISAGSPQLDRPMPH